MTAVAHRLTAGNPEIIVSLILRAAAVLPYLPERLHDTGWAHALRGALISLLLLVPALIVIRETQRAAVCGTAVELSPRQYGSPRDDGAATRNRLYLIIN